MIEEQNFRKIAKLIDIFLYLKFPKELDNPRKGLINIQNTDDNQCFKWSSINYLSPVNHYLAGIAKADKYLAKKLEFKI